MESNRGRIRSLTAVEHRNAALGANLIGALAGGLLQSMTFATGIKAPLLIVAALYLAAWMTILGDREARLAEGSGVRIGR